MHIATVLIVAGSIFAGTAAYAAGEGKDEPLNSGPLKKSEMTPMRVEQAVGNTAQMTCSQARAEVKGVNGVVLRTGANNFDRYHRSGGACDRKEQELQPAMVRTKDNALCFIGYTCEDMAVGN